MPTPSPHAAETNLRPAGYVRHADRVLGSGGNRLRWDDLPTAVRDGVAQLLGGPVVEAHTQVGGFSPGSADRVRTAAGRRAFVKAVSAAQNPDSPAMHRREAAITAALPAVAPAPGLLGTVDVDGWIALVLDEVDGHTPAVPWRADELAPVLDALARLAAATTPCPVAGLPDVRESTPALFAGAHRLAADGIDVRGIDLAALATRGTAALGGDTLVHLDLRADNIVLTGAGAVLVDWPHACRGPAWLDTLLLLVEVDRHGGHDVDALLAAHPTTRGVDPDVLTGVLGNIAGYLIDSARRPPPAGLPAVREFQRVQGDALLDWIERRTADGTSDP